jgi:hypothetical protein
VIHVHGVFFSTWILLLLVPRSFVSAGRVVESTFTGAWVWQGLASAAG